MAIARELRQRLPYVLLALGFIAAYHVRTTDLQHQEAQTRAVAAAACAVSIRDWNAWQKVIATTRNPPSLQGHITPSQRASLDTYAHALSIDVGPRPDC